MRYGIIGALDEEIALVKEQMTEVKEHKLYGRSFYTCLLYTSPSPRD
mgnify:CR=1 FL=1